MLKKIIYITLGIIVIALTILKLKSNKEIAQQRIYVFDKEKPIRVNAITLKAVEPTFIYTFSGNFKPEQESKISTDIQGKVDDILVDEGSRVYKGQALIHLNHSLLDLQLQSIDVQIEGLEKDLKRYTTLAKADAIQGVQLEKTKIALRSSILQRETILEQLNKTIIRSPFEGIITAKYTEKGSFAAPGMPLLQITNINHLKFSINVSENQLSLFEKNRTCSVTADAYPELVFSGKITQVGNQANKGNSYPIVFRVNNTASLLLKSGMFGKVTIERKAAGKQVIIPASAIIGSTVRPQVYLVKKGKATVQDISISERQANNVVVNEGLHSGDILITNGFINLFDSANVTLK